MFIVIFLIALFYVSENLWGMLILAVISGVLACYFFEDTIYLYKDKIEFQRKYIFGLYKKRSLFAFSDLTEISTDPKENLEEFVDLMTEYSLKKRLFICTRDGKTHVFKTFISQSELRRVISEVRIRAKEIPVSLM